MKLQATCKKRNLLSELMDQSGNYVHTALPFVLSLLQEGLGQRIRLLTHSLCPAPEVGDTPWLISLCLSVLLVAHINTSYYCDYPFIFYGKLVFHRQWSLEDEPPKHKAQLPLTFGLLLRPELATSVLERGPPADSPQVPTSVLIYDVEDRGPFILFYKCQGPCESAEINLVYKVPVCRKYGK